MDSNLSCYVEPHYSKQMQKYPAEKYTHHGRYEMIDKQGNVVIGKVE